MKSLVTQPLMNSGIQLNYERHQNTLVLRFKPVGRLSEDDYDRLGPQLDAALYSINTSRVNALMDLSELGDIDLRNAWKDILWMHQYSTEFDRIAMYHPRPWHHLLARVYGWLIAGEIKTFDQYQDALHWSHAH